MRSWASAAWASLCQRFVGLGVWSKDFISSSLFLVKILLCIGAWSKKFGSGTIVGRVLIDVDSDRAFVQIHVEEMVVHQFQVFDKRVIPIDIIYVNGVSWG
jgi:hypothetical protein